MAAVKVIPVRGRTELRAFIDLPWKIYAGDRNWVPPIKSGVQRLLNPRKHPFWNFSEREIFVAMRGSEEVGRIAAIVDGNYNHYHNARMGIWGFFECMRDPEAAVALFSAAERWVQDKGMEFLRGPLNPSRNYEVGMLIQGFESPPAFMMTHNPPYYPELVRLCGFRKEKDLLAFRLTREYQPPEWALVLAQRLAQKDEIWIRHADRRKLETELLLFNRLQNECMADLWGFVPMTDEEIMEVGKPLFQVVDTDLAFFLYYKEEPVGLCLMLPDINPFLKRLNGQLGPSALIKKYLYWKEIKGLRGLLIGVKGEYRQMGVPLVAFHHLVRVAQQKQQYQYVELGWTQEDNQAINRIFEEGGVRPHKRYRIYRKDV